LERKNKGEGRARRILASLLKQLDRRQSPWGKWWRGGGETSVLRGMKHCSLDIFIRTCPLGIQVGSYFDEQMQSSRKKAFPDTETLEPSAGR
jgi:hypothetical protein